MLVHYFDNLNIIIRQIFKEYKSRKALEFEINKNYFKNLITGSISKKLKKLKK